MFIIKQEDSINVDRQGLGANPTPVALARLDGKVAVTMELSTRMSMLFYTYTLYIDRISIVFICL